MKRILLTLIMLIQLVSACPAMCASNSCAAFVDCDLGYRHDYNGQWNFFCSKVAETGNYCTTDKKCVSCGTNSLCPQACPTNKPVWDGSKCVARDTTTYYKVCDNNGKCNDCSVGVCWGCPAETSYWNGSACIKKLLSYDSMKINGQEATSISAAPGTLVQVEFKNLTIHSQTSGTTCVGIVRSWGDSVERPSITGLTAFCISAGGWSTHKTTSATYNFTMPSNAGNHKVGIIVHKTDASNNYNFVDANNGCTLASILADSNWDDGISCFDNLGSISVGVRACETNNDCSAGNICSNYACVSCTSGETCATCPSETPYWTGSVCGECTSTNFEKCSLGEKCSAGTCTACIAGELCATCDTSAPYWNGTNCVACTVNTQCIAGQKCSNQQCISCEFGEECASCPIYSPYSNGAGGCVSCLNITNNVYVNRDLFLCNGAHNIVDSEGDGVLIFNSSATVDCNGGYYYGNNNGYFAFINGKNNVTLKNCRLSNYKTAVMANNSNNVKVLGNYIHDTTDPGVYFDYISNGTISYNNLTRVNTTNKGYEGAIFVNNSINNNVTNNYLFDNKYENILVMYSNNTLVKENKITTNFEEFFFAIDILHGEGTIVENNNITDIGTTAIEAGAIADYISNNTTIRYNKIVGTAESTGNLEGMNLFFSTSIKVYENYITNCTYMGISNLDNITSDIYENNTFSVYLSSPADLYESSSKTVDFQFTPSNILNWSSSEPTTTICKLYIDDIATTTLNNSVLDNTLTTLTHNFAENEEYSWYIYCYDSDGKNNAGTSETRTITINEGGKSMAMSAPEPTPEATPAPTPTPEPLVLTVPNKEIIQPKLGVEQVVGERFTMHAIAGAIENAPEAKIIPKIEKTYSGNVIKVRIQNSEKIEQRISNVNTIGYTITPDEIKKEGEEIVLVWNTAENVEYWYTEAKQEKGMIDSIIEYLLSLIS